MDTALDQRFEPTLANRSVAPWRITTMLVAKGGCFLQEINTLLAGSPIRFLRILSYGLANLRITRRANSIQSGQPSPAKKAALIALLT
ncbi:MAG: hypothetical protein E5V96_03620 [Mesorhizobium sp.]|nr:MAG: hypothetical protein E5V96_03620 [Mesorhizobium sp.]TIW04315.1 MAG: hypothetical protein E5V77_00945 [Mesorhizobium sp.]